MNSTTKAAEVVALLALAVHHHTSLPFFSPPALRRPFQFHACGSGRHLLPALKRFAGAATVRSRPRRRACHGTPCTAIYDWWDPRTVARRPSLLGCGPPLSPLPLDRARCTAHTTGGSLRTATYTLSSASHTRALWRCLFFLDLTPLPSWHTYRTDARAYARARYSQRLRMASLGTKACVHAALHARQTHHEKIAMRAL